MQVSPASSSSEPKEPRVRTVFNIVAATAGVFGLGLEMEGTHPYFGLFLMGSALAYGFWELFTSPAAIRKLRAPVRVLLMLALSGAFLWVSWPHFKKVALGSGKRTERAVPKGEADKGKESENAAAPGSAVPSVPKKETSKSESKRTPPNPSLKGRSLALSQEIETWVEPKFNQRAKVSDPKNPDEYYRAREEYDRNTTAEFNSRFSKRLNEIVKELDRCNADITMLKQSMESPTRVEHFGFIATWLRSAAHNIPEGQPECGTGEPTQGFGERDTGLYMLLMGGSETGYYKEDLEGGPQSAGITTLGGKHQFKIYIRDGIFCIDAKVFGGYGMPLIDVVCNRIAEPPLGWDTNYTDKAIEVVDGNQNPMFQMIFENPRRIRINGLFLGENNQLFIDTPRGTEKIDLNKQQTVEDPLKRLFKYPAWKFLHQYAD